MAEYKKTPSAQNGVYKGEDSGVEILDNATLEVIFQAGNRRKFTSV